MSAVDIAEAMREQALDTAIDSLVKQIVNRDGDYLAALDELEALARRTAPQVDVQVDVSRRPARFIEVTMRPPAVNARVPEERPLVRRFLAVDHITEVTTSERGTTELICAQHTIYVTQSVEQVLQLIDGESRRA